MTRVPRVTRVPRAKRSPRGDPRRGAALLVVLVFSALLAALAAAASRSGVSGARAAAVFADAVRADELGRGAADALTYRLLTGDAEAKRGGAVGLRLPGADVTIDYLSESARVDANAAPVPLIAALLGAAGAEPAEVEAVSARIARLRAEAKARAEPPPPAADAPVPGGLAALRAAVDALGPAHPRKPAAGPAAIRDLSEVAAAWGLSDALARRVLPSLTVSSGAATVDPVLAARPILLALLGGDERADDYLRRRREGFVDRDAALLLLPVPSRDFAGFTDVPAVRAVARVRLADRFERRYEFVLAPPRAAAPPAAAADAGDAPPDAGEARPAPPGDGRPVVVSWRVIP